MAEGEGHGSWTQTLCSGFFAPFWGFDANFGLRPITSAAGPVAGLGDGSSAVQPAHPYGSANLIKANLCCVPSLASASHGDLCSSLTPRKERQDSGDGNEKRRPCSSRDPRSSKGDGLAQGLGI